MNQATGFCYFDNAAVMIKKLQDELGLKRVVIFDWDAHCGNGTMESVELGRQGIIYSCTVVYRDSPVGIKAPYAYGYVQIPENNLRVFALLTGKEATSFAPGEAVDLVVEPIRTDGAGRNVVGYKFRARA